MKRLTCGAHVGHKDGKSLSCRKLAVTEKWPFRCDDHKIADMEKPWPEFCEECRAVDVAFDMRILDEQQKGQVCKCGHTRCEHCNCGCCCMHHEKGSHHIYCRCPGYKDKALS